MFIVNKTKITLRDYIFKETKTRSSKMMIQIQWQHLFQRPIQIQNYRIDVRVSGAQRVWEICKYDDVTWEGGLKIDEAIATEDGSLEDVRKKKQI